MVCATGEDHDGIEFCTSVVLLMQTRLEIRNKEDLQVGMCLAYLEVRSVG